MSIVDRIKNIILNPKTEWLVINGETETPPSLFTKYVIPLLLIGAAADFIGYGFVGTEHFFKIKGINWGAWFAIQRLASGVIGYFVSTYVIDGLAPNFSSGKNLGKSAQLVAYASTPSWIAAIFMVVPSLGFLGLFGLYGIYLFYIGLPVLKNTPEDKRVGYMIVSALVIIAVSWVAQWFVGLVLNPILGNPYAEASNQIRNMFKY